ncbi:MAG: NADH-quinone oxidoreductase subunit NuoB, partial [Desulfurococcaceae archaeon]
KLAPSIRHGDVLVVTGAVTKKAAERLKRLYDQMPSVKYVVAVGACAYDGGVFKGSYSVVGGANKVVPVHAYVPGCPPRPEEILRAILMLLGREKVEVRLTE